MHDAFRHLITISAGHVFAGLDRSIDPIIDRVGQYPGRYGAIDVIPTPGVLRPLDRWRKTRIEAARSAPVLDRLIAERRDPDYAGRRDLLWRLVNVRDRETGAGLTRDELHDEILTLGNTAITTLRALPWVWYLLATHPWAERRLHAELDQVLGNGPPGVRDLAKLTWLRQVLDEAMRLYPPLPIMMLRRAAADDTVCGRRIPRGSVVLIMPWVVHRHRKLWHDPDRFDPERFAPEAIAGAFALCLSAVRGRAACLRRRVDGDAAADGGGRGAGAAFPLPSRAGPPRRADRLDQYPPARRDVDDLGTAPRGAEPRGLVHRKGKYIEPIAWTTPRPKDGMMVAIEKR